MKRCNPISAGFISLLAIASVTISHAADLQVSPSKPSTTSAPSTKTRQFPKTTAGFIPAKLEQSNFPFEGGRNVFGKDDRIPMNSSKHPWSAIGRVEALNGNQLDWTCTGTLIGKSLVVTNAHCVLDEKTKQITTNKIRFRPNLINGEAPAEAFATKVVTGTNDPNRDRGNDWAFLVLDRPLGETYGVMKFAIADFADLDSIKGEINLAGYSSDFPKEKPSETAGVHQGCSIRGFGSQLGTVSHDCDMMAGASGGPMFAIFPDGSAVIIALNAAERVSREGTNPKKFSGPTANIGVYATTWAKKAEELLKSQR
ncbi:MAG: trypsin-like peptidase domain-containing protein [Leptolyngbyaceae cyanobacterium CAN_BIN12]|nr:trypsin-like peptidase domain-containing protein [Leptolyngbyaceae cyanobacterium CAN_BIN12]